VFQKRYVGYKAVIGYRFNTNEALEIIGIQNRFSLFVRLKTLNHHMENIPYLLMGSESLETEL
jgi:hypothetical protein